MALEKMIVDEFIELLGSDAPAPGGGAAAALTMSIGVALSEMVCSLSANSKKYADSREQILSWKNACNTLARKALAGMEEDAIAYKKVNDAYKLPRETEEERAMRNKTIQEMLLVGATPPMNLMELGIECLELTRELVGNTTVMAISDLGVAALNINAGVKSAWLNVLINIGSMEDESLAAKLREKGEGILAQSEALSTEIYDAVIAKL